MPTNRGKKSSNQLESPRLAVKLSAKRSQNSVQNYSPVKQRRRYRPGALALKEIKRYQKTANLLVNINSLYSNRCSMNTDTLSIRSI